MKRIHIFCLLFLCCSFINGIGATEEEGWTIETNSRENYNGITLANGRIGLVTNSSLFSLKEINLSSVFDKESENGGVSRIVRSPLFLNLCLKINGEKVNESNISCWEQLFNMKEAYLQTSFTFKGVDVKYTIRALRNLPYMGMSTLNIMTKKPVSIEVINEAAFPEELKETRTEFRLMRDGAHILPVYISESMSRTYKQKIATSTAFLVKEGKRDKISKVQGEKFEAMQISKDLKANESWSVSMAGAVCTSRDFFDPKSEAERMAVFALQHDINDLLQGHKDLWSKLWESDIEIEGCLQDQLDVRLALYNLYSFQRAGARLSISPMGLSSSGYNGHVFWDSELWMYPPMLVLNQDLARAHIDYRFDRLAKAKQRASLFNFKGAMYPWESDDSGEEATPSWCLTGTFENHITADIGIAFWNYFRVTQDKEWLRKEGFLVIKAVADYWVSRVTKNEDGSYSIKNVVGANEYAPNVDDNAFTNGSAKVALRNAVKAANLLGEPVDKLWQKVSDGICFHHMADGTTKEHATYDGAIIKQADVNLLAYPLQVVTDKESIKKDLYYYEKKIDRVHGPAMGNAILSILYSRLGNSKKAYEFFHLAFHPNKRPPFGVLSESASSNNPYFATGAGGMLQAVVFGFAGLELTDEGIIQHTPMLPKSWKSLTLKGVGKDKKTIRID